MPQDHLPGSPERHYRSFLQAGLFCVQRCRDCARALSYPRTVCLFCGSAQLELVDASGQGVVYSTTVVRRPKDAGGDYNVALIELAEGTRLMSRVEGIAPHRVEIGMKVVAAVRTGGVEPLLVFEPASDAAR